jgi:hypothetical protein
MSKSRARPGFALLELAVCICVLGGAVLIAALLVPDARRRARLAGSITNLQQLGAAAHAFATDNENRVFSFSWTPGPHSCGGFVFPNAGTHAEAAADQAICIIRERGNRPDITTVRGWIPHVLYSHLALNDYLADPLPSPVLASPGDAPRIAWQRAARVAARDPSDLGSSYFRLLCRPSPGTNSTGEKRWSYSSSYELQPSFFSPDAQVNTPEGLRPTVAQGSTHRQYTIPVNTAALGTRRMDEVWYPSHKAMMYESAQRFFGRDVWLAAPEARVPILFADGSGSTRSTNRANFGFLPNTPTSPNPTRIEYQPEPSWEVPATNGGVSEFYNGVFRWTRSGLRGRDFMGPEVPWVP